MARTSKVLISLLLGSLHLTGALKVKNSGEQPRIEVLLNKDVSSDEMTARKSLVAGNCDMLTVRGGLDLGEMVKVSANGWAKEEEDLTISLVNDQTRWTSVLRKIDEVALGTLNVPESVEDLATALPEGVSDPYISVRIGGLGEDGQKRPSAVLTYQNGTLSPVETPIDTPAGPHTPFFVLFEKKTRSTFDVSVFVWISSGEHEAGAAAGKWSSTTVNVEAGVNNHDLMVTANGGDAKVLKLYASSSKTILTAAANTCGDVSQPIVEIIPSPGGDNTRQSSNAVMRAVPQLLRNCF